MAIGIRSLTEQDLSFAETLRSVAGWNQTENDWKRYLACQPDGCFLAEIDGHAVATLTTTCFQKDLAWIGMVLVNPDFRRRGIARALMEHALDFLDRQGIRCVKLDATPQGKPLYEQLGFVDEWTLKRWKASAWESSQSSGIGGQVRSIREEDWSQILSMDTEAFGASRESLLRILARQSDQAMVAVDSSGKTVVGYGMFRQGVIAAYLGPLVAFTFENVSALVDGLTFSHAQQPLFWDIPDVQGEAIALATSRGMQPQRDLVRMYRHTNRIPGIPRMQWGIADPATG